MGNNGSENEVKGRLISLYKNFGYKLYKPSCFEEYSLYQDNKDFLIGKNVIAFSDLSGRLMAMRPDVTLSLIKHEDINDRYTQKYYYNEKVYRQAADGKEFKEISQIGTEIIGKIDDVCVCEEAILMCETLSAISEDYLLDISHMGFIEGLLNEFGDTKNLVADCLKNKNLHDFKKLSKNYLYDQKLINAFEVTLLSCGSPQDALSRVEDAVLNEQMKNSLTSLSNLCNRLEKLGYGNKIRIDFSVTNNADYYNGEVFNGYINGIYHRVLSGGRYDKLINKFEKSGGAVGFALYLGELDRYFSQEGEEVDYLIIYDDKTQTEALSIANEKLNSGYSMRLSNTKIDDIKYKNVINLTKEAL